MENIAKIKTLSNDVQRIGNKTIYVDLINTSCGLIRVGSMPDISKFMAQKNFQEDFVIVPDWFVTQGGDNRTGEEFVLWRRVLKGMEPIVYIGKQKNINVLFQKLQMTFPYFFNNKMISIVRKRWLNKLFKKAYIEPEMKFSYKTLKILFKNNHFFIYDRGQMKYNSRQYYDGKQQDSVIEELLNSVERDFNSRDAMEITVLGNGNGLVGTSSSFILYYGRRIIWIDPCAQPAYILSRYRIHWDDITDILITHVHEDHILGFTACLKRKIDQGRKLKLITNLGSYKILLQMFSPLFPTIKDSIVFTEIKPGKNLLLDGLKFISRWNHHILPYGTLGLKIEGGGFRWGLSGDTKFDRKINRILRRPELTEKWFKDCQLIFHEVDFDNSMSIHSYWAEVKSLEKSLTGKLYAYHTIHNVNPSIPIVKEGKTYSARNF